jgi:hypothetical protein
MELQEVLVDAVDAVDGEAVVDTHCLEVLFVDYSSHFAASFLFA